MRLTKVDFFFADFLGQKSPKIAKKTAIFAENRQKVATAGPEVGATKWPQQGSGGRRPPPRSRGREALLTFSDQKYDDQKYDDKQ